MISKKLKREQKKVFKKRVENMPSKVIEFKSNKKYEEWLEEKGTQ